MDPRKLRLPDRFEALRESPTDELATIITPVERTLGLIDDRFLDLRAAQRGGFMIFRGNSGAGKSTFLNTVGLFRVGVTTVRISRSDDIRTTLENLPTTDDSRIVILEGREALGKVSTLELEAAMHEVNQFVRTAAGVNTLVVWPTNKDDLTELLVNMARDLGDETLLDPDEPVTQYAGPPKSDFVAIAERTVATLNEGITLPGLGITEDRAMDIATSAPTIGRYLAQVRREAIQAGDKVQGLMTRERYRLWTVVVAGNDVEGDVAALTRGGQALADMSRLLGATGANVVGELKAQPDQIGILGTVLDARIFHLDMHCVLAVARQYGSAALHDEMKERGMQVSKDSKAGDRLSGSDLGIVLSGATLGTRKRGPKPGNKTAEAFTKLTDIARSNDTLLNDAVGRGLVAIGLISDSQTERPLGTDFNRTSDIYGTHGGAPLRLEMMWRAKAGRADIANYVLGKLNNYGKAIGLLGRPTVEP